MTTFNTKQEMASAGFIPARQRLIENYKGCDIYSSDVSGPNSFGYVFAITVRFPDYDHNHPYGPGSGHSQYWADNFYNVHFAYSTKVWLSQEKNKIGSLGAFSVQYAPDAYENGLRAARDAIGKYISIWPVPSCREVARYQGREEAIDAEIERLRSIDPSQPITDNQLACLCRNTIISMRPTGARIGEFKRLLIGGGGAQYIRDYLANTDRVFERLYFVVE